MSVCSATAAASQRPVGRRDSRQSASRSSASETYLKKGGVGQYGQRKCSSASSSKIIKSGSMLRNFCRHDLHRHSTFCIFKICNNGRMKLVKNMCFTISERFS